MTTVNFVLLILVILYLVYKEVKSFLNGNFRTYPSWKTYQSVKFHLFKKKFELCLYTGRNFVFRYDDRHFQNRYDYPLIVIYLFPIDWILDRFSKQKQGWYFFKVSKFKSYEEYVQSDHG
jgi:hypothetical protein